MSGWVKINRTGLSEILRGEKGPVARDLAIKAQRVTNAAKRRCPVDTSRLRASIRYRMVQDAQGLGALVGSDVEYAIYVHEGTRPHWPPAAALQPWAGRHGFPKNGSGGFMVAAAIAARGTKGRPFLTEALLSTMGGGTVL